MLVDVVTKTVSLQKLNLKSEIALLDGEPPKFLEIGRFGWDFEFKSRIFAQIFHKILKYFQNLIKILDKSCKDVILEDF